MIPLHLRQCRLLVVAVGVVSCIIYIIIAMYSGNSGYQSPSSESDQNKLERILKHASMKDNTVILTTLNEAWAAPNSVMDLFLVSFNNNKGTRPLLKHLVIISLDEKAYSRCMVVHSHCYPLRVPGVDFSEEARYGSPEYLMMIWRRTDFLRSILEIGYNFVFTDADIMWFRDPFPHFYKNTDFQIACDIFKFKSDDKRNLPNGGFLFVKSNNRTREFYKFWYDSRVDYPGEHEQYVLNQIKHDHKITEIGIKMKFLGTKYFSGFCEVSDDLNKVVTMHANCCVGLKNKLHDLRLLLEDWGRYKSKEHKYSSKPTGSLWRVPQDCHPPNEDADVLESTMSRYHTL